MDFIIENRAIDGAVVQAEDIFVLPRNSSINLCIVHIYIYIYVTNKPRKFVLMKQLHLEA